MTIPEMIFFFAWFAFWIGLSRWSWTHGPIDRADREHYMAMRKFARSIKQ